MATTNFAKLWWLLTARGIVYVVIGVTMFVFASTYSAQSASILGILAIVAGICGLIYAFTNARAEPNYIWHILHGITDIAFGIAMFIYSDGTIKGFVDVLGFWAVMYAFLQSVQAMYLFMASAGNARMSTHYPFKLLHFGQVFVAGLLAFTLLLRPQGFTESLGIVGIYPIILGLLVAVLSFGYRVRAENS